MDCNRLPIQESSPSWRSQATGDNCPYEALRTALPVRAEASLRAPPPGARRGPTSVPAGQVPVDEERAQGEDAGVHHQVCDVGVDTLLVLVRHRAQLPSHRRPPTAGRRTRQTAARQPSRRGWVLLCWQARARARTLSRRAPLGAPS